MYGEAACIIDQKLRTKIAKKRDQTQTEYSVGTIYIHTYIHIYIYIYIYMCVCVCVYVLVHYRPGEECALPPTGSK